jgi:hypothetical protein
MFFVVRFCRRFAAEICRNCVKIRPRRQKWAAPIDSLFLTIGAVARRGNQRRSADDKNHILATIKKQNKNPRDKKRFLA